jgi:hypothetical protein
MSFMNTLKDKLGMSRGRADDSPRQHGDKVERGMDTTTQTLDSKAGGKYSDRADSGTEQPKDARPDRQDKGDGPA